MDEPRLTCEESFAVLRRRGIVTLSAESWDDPGEIDTPRLGRSHRGLHLRDAKYEEIDFENLSLRRTLVERCTFHGVSFRDTDLTLSCVCAEFVDCDFSEADLYCARFEGSSLFACRFVNARLIGAEFRGVSLEHCDFTGANLTGSRFDRGRHNLLRLSDEQRRVMLLRLSDEQRRVMVDWRCPDDIGPDDPKDE